MIELPVIQKGLEIGQINLETGKIKISNYVEFTCQSRIDCCTDMRIPASEHDIQRIMDNGYELDQIVRDLSPVFLNPSSPHDTEKAYILKSKPYEGSCTFLEDKLCKIHEFKPFACKIYPFALEFDSDVEIRIVIHQDQLCEAISSVPKKASNSEEILQNMLSLILEELEERGIN